MLFYQSSKLFCSQCILRSKVIFSSLSVIFKGPNVHFSDAFDNRLILKTLQNILEGKVCQIPLYDFKTNSRYLISLYDFA